MADGRRHDILKWPGVRTQAAWGVAFSRVTARALSATRSAAQVRRLTIPATATMRKYTRKDFLSFSALLAGAASVARAPFARSAWAAEPLPLQQTVAGIEVDMS
jgi:hypothetical protein